MEIQHKNHFIEVKVDCGDTGDVIRGGKLGVKGLSSEMDLAESR